MTPTTQNELAEGILTYLKKHDALSAIPQVIERLEREQAQQRPITIISATELNKKDTDELVKKATTAWGKHPIELLVDPSLLSGFLIRFNDQLIDLSGKGRLNQLQSSLS